MRLLVDENISPLIIESLRGKGHDVKAVRELAKGAKDEEIIQTAIKENRTLLTQDKDMGHIYYFSKRENLRIIILRPSPQSLENLRKLLEDFLGEIEKRKEKALYIVEESGYRTLK